MKKPNKVIVVTGGALVKSGELHSQTIHGISDGEHTIAVVDNEGKLQGYTRAKLPPEQIPVALEHGHIIVITNFSSHNHPPRIPTVAPPGQEYVDPYLFETGHFESREEYEELSRTAKIKPRAKA